MEDSERRLPTADPGAGAEGTLASPHRLLQALCAETRVLSWSTTPAPSLTGTRALSHTLAPAPNPKLLLGNLHMSAEILPVCPCWGPCGSPAGLPHPGSEVRASSL